MSGYITSLNGCRGGERGRIRDYLLYGCDLVVHRADFSLQPRMALGNEHGHVSHDGLRAGTHPEDAKS